jgi:hypothetical protein
VVLIQKTTRLSTLLTNDAASTSTAEPEPGPKGKRNIGKSDLLDWNLHGTKSFVQFISHYLGKFRRLLLLNHVYYLHLQKYQIIEGGFMS